MTNFPAPTSRSGQSNHPQGVGEKHTLVALVYDRPGSVDRVIGLLRRRRANAQTLLLEPAEQPDFVRITVQMVDTEVAVDQLIEQLRKIVDVQQVEHKQ